MNDTSITHSHQHAIIYLAIENENKPENITKLKIAVL